MKTFPLLLCLCVTSWQVANAQFAPHSDPDNAGGWTLNESVSDEFNGDTLDQNKWHILGKDGNYRGRWKGRAPSQYAPHNVIVGDGNLTIKTQWEPNYKFSAEPLKGQPYGKPIPITTGCIISEAKFKYGYMEMRCKAADGPVSSAFWTTGEGGEIDVFEHFGQKPNDNYSARRYHTSFHDWRKGSPTIGTRIWTNDHQLDFRVADDFHVYGLQWSPNLVKIFVDGQLVNCVTKEEIGDRWVASHDQMVWIDSELFPWEVGSDKLTESDFAGGREFIIDYCRIWQRETNTDTCLARTNLVANPGFETGLDSWTGGGQLSEDAHLGQSAVTLKTQGTIEQTVTVKPNTTYILSAWVKCPETNMKDRWSNAYLGVKDHGGQSADTRFFMPGYERRSLQFKTGPTAHTATIFYTNLPQGSKAVVDDIELIEASAR